MQQRHAGDGLSRVRQPWGSASIGSTRSANNEPPATPTGTSYSGACAANRRHTCPMVTTAGSRLAAGGWLCGLATGMILVHCCFVAPRLQLFWPEQQCYGTEHDFIICGLLFKEAGRPAWNRRKGLATLRVCLGNLLAPRLILLLVLLQLHTCIMARSRLPSLVLWLFASWVVSRVSSCSACTGPSCCKTRRCWAQLAEVREVEGRMHCPQP